MATPAPCLRKLLNDATKRWPARSRISDGLMPSAEHHKQNPNSDHERGNAADLTHDPEHGVVGDEIAKALIESKDPRIKYIIFNHRIWFPTAGKHPQGWSAHHGPNAHEHHVHISIKPEAREDMRPWPWSPESQPQPAPQTRPLLSYGDGFIGEQRGLNSRVKELQTMLNSALAKLGIKFTLEIDGKYGKGVEKAVMKFQSAVGLVPDSKCGTRTWAALDEALKQ